MFNAKLFTASLICFCSIGVHSIVSKASSQDVLEKSSMNKEDNSGAESISRDYNIAGFDDAYGHEGYGLSAHVNYGLPEEHAHGIQEGHNLHGYHFDSYHHHHSDHHKHHDYNYHKALALKGLLVPLAGVALLGAAAAFVSNPILLQLGVISGTSLGRRKRNALRNFNQIKEEISEEDRIRLHEIKLLEKFINKIPKEDVKLQNKRLFADYLSCSGITSENECLERVACELNSPEGTSMPVEVNVLSIVVNEILQNDFVSESVKNGLSQAIQHGKKDMGCKFYRCDDIDKNEKLKAL